MKNNIGKFLYVFFISILLIPVSCRDYKENTISSIRVRKPSENPNFITTWKITDTKGLLSEKRIIIPTNPDYKYRYNVKWSKKDEPSIKGEKLNNSSTTIIDFPSAGEYKVEISDTFPAIFFNHMNDKDENDIYYRDKIISVDNWGNIEWESMEGSFARCKNLQIMAKDAPDLSKVKSMRDMFYGVENLTASLNHWDVSNVTDMGYIFFGCRYFNQPLNNWDVSNVTDMGYMFFGCRSFDKPLNNWNVSNVTRMDYMFYRALFNKDIGNWNVGNVRNMNNMFCESSFNKPINNWNVRKVENMSNMFNKAIHFNQPLDSWNVHNVIDMSFMFQNATQFNQSLNSWKLNDSIDLKYIFFRARSFDKQNISKWNLDKIKESRKKDMFGE